MEISDIKERLKIEKILSHYGLQAPTGRRMPNK
jgi:hypothetical protein